MSRTHHRTARAAALLLSLACALPVSALDLTFPGPATMTANRSERMTSLRLPVGPYAEGGVPTQLVEGHLSMAAFQMSLERPSTLDLMRGLRAQITAAGLEVVFECETDACGGFDFRYGTEVLPEPDMHVDLGDFRYLVARGAGSHLALLISRSDSTGFVQVTEVGKAAKVSTSAPGPKAAPGLAAPAPEAVPAAVQSETMDLVDGLQAGTAQVLEDLAFPSGSASLAEGRYASLDTLAEWLRADPVRRVVLVGHTDASGALDANVKLSRLRAESVRQVLLFAGGVSPEQVSAEGIGFLSPRASNLTEEGRQKNRRVEVMATSTQPLAP